MDAAFQVAIDNRIDFTWHVGTEADPSAIATWEGSASNDPDGAVAIVIPDTGQRLWLTYAVDMVNPSGVGVLLDQAYTASYTWS